MPLAWQRALPVDWTLKGRWDRNVISRSPGHHRQVAQRRSVIETMCFAVLKNGMALAPSFSVWPGRLKRRKRAAGASNGGTAKRLKEKANRERATCAFRSALVSF